MTSSDNFRDALTAGNLGKALTLALSEAIQLEITTWVAEKTDDVSPDLDTSARVPPPGQRMYTRINIVDGDIENEIGRDFVDGPYAELRDFHLQEVEKGITIIKQNLENLQQLFVTLSNTLDDLAHLSRSRNQPEPRMLTNGEGRLNPAIDAIDTTQTNR